jgi:tetratricopeptide (TPR) repeat protein
MGDFELQLTRLESAQLVRQLAELEREYVFRHALIQDAAYASLLLKERRELHSRIAAIYEEQHAKHIDEYTALLAHHYAAAGETEKAIAYLHRTGKRAKHVGALTEALESFQHALAMAPQADLSTRADLSVQIGTVQELRGEYQAASEWLRAGLGLARESGDNKTAARALSGLATVAVNQGEYETAKQSAHHALGLAREVGDSGCAALSLRTLGVVAGYAGDYVGAVEYCQASLALYKGLGDRRGVNLCLNSLGIFAFDQDKFDTATRYFDQALALSYEIGDRRAIAIRLINLGDVAVKRHEYDAAKAYLVDALVSAREVGSKEDIATIILNLGDIAAMQGDAGSAYAYYRDALAQSVSIGAMPLVLNALVGIAGLMAKGGDANQSAEILGFALNHAASSAELRKYGEPTLSDVTSALPAHELEAAVNRGKAMDLDAMLGLLGRTPPASDAHPERK